MIKIIDIYTQLANPFTFAENFFKEGIKQFGKIAGIFSESIIKDYYWC